MLLSRRRAVSGLSTRAERARDNRRSFVRIGLVLSVVALVLGAVQFARYDWTGLPLQRSPAELDRTISADCHEQVRPFTTSAGRTISPSPIDDQQYLSMIDWFRGERDLQVECFYRPFTDRALVPLVASWLPFEDALSLALVNTALMLAGIWLVLATLVVQGATPRVVLAAGSLVVVNWTTLAFGTGVLIESAPFAAVALAWLLISLRRWWWAAAVIGLGVLAKETVVLALPPLWVALSLDRPNGVGAGAALRRWAPLAVASAAAAIALVARRVIGPPADASWPTGVDLSLVSFNLNPAGLAVRVLGRAPVRVPSALWFVRRTRSAGFLAACTDPAVAGVASGLLLLAWILITADLSPRFFWPCFPFAATLVARWFGDGRPQRWLDGLRLPPWLVGERDERAGAAAGPAL